MIPVGTPVAILVAGTFSPVATHRVTGYQTGHAAPHLTTPPASGGCYLLICSLEALDKIGPKQTYVPVTRITEDRVAVRHA